MSIIRKGYTNMKTLRDTSIIWQEDNEYNNKRRRFALLIGVEYEHQYFIVSVIKRETRNLYQLLSSQWPREHIRMLLGKDTTKGVIIDQIRAYSSFLEPGDMFLLYFSGHGGIDRRD